MEFVVALYETIYDTNAQLAVMIEREREREEREREEKRERQSERERGTQGETCLINLYRTQHRMQMSNSFLQRRRY
jgi:hypothetical protein